MQLSRLPLSILIGLELVTSTVSCGPCLEYALTESESDASDAGSTMSVCLDVSACLSPPYETVDATEPVPTSSTVGPMTGTGTMGTTSTTGTTDSSSTGSTSGPETSTGPCLDVAPTTGTTGTDTDTDTDTDTSGTSGGFMADDGPPDDPVPAQVIERVLSRAQLPEDVIARLRRRLDRS